VKRYDELRDGRNILVLNDGKTILKIYYRIALVKLSDTIGRKLLVSEIPMLFAWTMKIRVNEQHVNVTKFSPYDLKKRSNISILNSTSFGQTGIQMKIVLRPPMALLTLKNRAVAHRNRDRFFCSIRRSMSVVLIILYEVLDHASNSHFLINHKINFIS